MYIHGHIRYSSGNVPLKVLFNGKTSNNSLKLYAVKLPHNKGRVTFRSETNRMVQNITHFDPLLAEISHKIGQSTFFFKKKSVYISSYIVNFSWTARDGRLNFLPLIQLWELYLWYKFERKRMSCSKVINDEICKKSVYKVSKIWIFGKRSFFFNKEESCSQAVFFINLFLARWAFFWIPSRFFKSQLEGQN